MTRRDPTPEMEDDLRLMAEMAKAAASAIGAYLDQAFDVANKAASGFDPVTGADRDGELAIRAVLKAHRPEDGIEGEEFGPVASRSGRTWVLDPIDGTRAFMLGVPVWTTLIARVDEGLPVLGAIAQPVLGELYLGWPGGATLARGAFSNPDTRTPLSVRSCAALREGILATTDYFLFNAPERGAFEHLRATARMTRFGLDAYAYARLAAGSLDMVAEAGLQTYDMAALIPVVTGAGGMVTDWRGQPVRLDPASRGQIVASGDRRALDDGLISLRRSAES